jgi:hypothetical protein
VGYRIMFITPRCCPRLVLYQTTRVLDSLAISQNISSSTFYHVLYHVCCRVWTILSATTVHCSDRHLWHPLPHHSLCRFQTWRQRDNDLANAYWSRGDANHSWGSTYRSKWKPSTVRCRRKLCTIWHFSHNGSSPDRTHLRSVNFTPSASPMKLTNNQKRCLFIPTIGVWTNRLNLALFHLIILVSILLGVVFGAPKDHSDTGDHSPVNATASKTGYILLMLCLMAFFVQGIYFLHFRVQDAISYKTSRHLKTLIYSMLASLPFAMIRVGHEIAYIFDPSMDRNIEVGPFTYIFFISFLMPLAATVPLVVGGFKTRNINTGDLGLVREESRRPFREEDVELKNTREEVEEQHNRRHGQGAPWV